jgi:RNA polymerase sigma-70 factor (ECF subfamily)
MRVAADELSAELVAKMAPSDLVQETCLQATRDFPAFEGATEQELRSWLRQILLNNLRDLQRRFWGTRKRDISREIHTGDSSLNGQGLASLPCPAPSPSEVVVSSETRQAVDSALAGLSPEHRLVVQLRNFELLPFDEIGRQLQRTSEAARKLWVRAIEKLSVELNGHDHHERSRS